MTQCILKTKRESKVLFVDQTVSKLPLVTVQPLNFYILFHSNLDVDSADLDVDSAGK